MLLLFHAVLATLTSPEVQGAGDHDRLRSWNISSLSDLVHLYPDVRWPLALGKKSQISYAQTSSSTQDSGGYNDDNAMYQQTQPQVDVNPCATFNTGGVPHGHITSPNYPDQYLPNIDCYLTVYGNAGNAVVLDFRGNSFNVEEANGGDVNDRCKYDYLEIRDGPFGFSPLLGRFCGHEIPRDAIYAHSGYMWLHFHTDAELQRKGFRAEIKQVSTDLIQMPRVARNCQRWWSFPAEEDQWKSILPVQPATHTPIFMSHFCYSDHQTSLPCVIGNSVTADDGHVRTDFMKSLYDNIANTTDSFECIWVISTTDPAYKIRLFFNEFHLAYPNNCSMNMVQVYRNQTAASHMVKSLCSVIANPVDTNSGKAYIRIFLSAKAMQETSVQLVYSSYFRSQNEECTERAGLLPCGDGTCIPDHLACNGRQNCLYNKDEKECGPIQRAPIQFVKGPYLIILLIILGVIFSIIICSMVLNFCPRFRQQYEKNYSVGHRSAERSTATLTPVVSDPLNRKATLTMPMEAACSAGGSVPVPYELLYSTVVPGPNHASRLMEFMPKNDVENLHMLLCRQGCSLTSAKNNGAIRRAHSVGGTLAKDQQFTLHFSRDGGSAPPSEAPYADLDTESTSHVSYNGFCVRTVPNTPNTQYKAYAPLALATPDILRPNQTSPKWHESVSSNSRKSVKFSTTSSPAAPPPPPTIMQQSVHSLDGKRLNTRKMTSPQYSSASSDTLGELSLIDGVDTVSPSSYDGVVSPTILTPAFPTNDNLSVIKRTIEQKYAPPHTSKRKSSAPANCDRKDCVIVNL